MREIIGNMLLWLFIKITNKDIKIIKCYVKKNRKPQIYKIYQR